MSSSDLSSSSHRSRSRSPGEIPLHSHSGGSMLPSSSMSASSSSSSSALHSEYGGDEYDYSDHRLQEDGESVDQRRHRRNGNSDGVGVSVSSGASNNVSSSISSGSGTGTTNSNNALGLGMGPPHPADNNPPTRRIYVGNLPLSFNNDDLYRLFATFGNIRESFVTKDTHTGRSKQFGFVEFDQDEQAAHARNTMIGCVLDQHGNKVTGEDDSLIMNGKNPQGELRHKIRIRFAELKKHDDSLYMDDRLYISNLPDYVTDTDLRNKFEQFGELTEAIFATAKDTRQRLGSAFVQYKDPQAAKSALETLNGTHWNEREKKNEMAPLRINFARKQRIMIREERMQAGGRTTRGQYNESHGNRSSRRSPPASQAHTHYPPPPHHYTHHYPPHHYPPHHGYPPYSYPYPYPHSSNSSAAAAPHPRASYDSHRGERSRSRSREREHRYEREGRRDARRRSRSRTRSRSRSPRARREREQHSHRESHPYAADPYYAHPHYAHYAYPEAPYYPNAGGYPPTSSASATSAPSAAAHRDDLDNNHRAHHSAHTHRRREEHAYHTEENYGR